MKGFEFNNLTFSDNSSLSTKKVTGWINYAIKSNAFCIPSLTLSALGYCVILSPAITYTKPQNYSKIFSQDPTELENSIKGENICIYLQCIYL